MGVVEIVTTNESTNGKNTEEDSVDIRNLGIILFQKHVSVDKTEIQDRRDFLDGKDECIMISEV